MPNDLRIGILGAGRMGSLHARILAGHVIGATLAAVADLDEPLARACVESYGGRVMDGPALLANPEIDAVIIATPARTHCALIAEAARSGKHILCEKPIGWDLVEIDAALADADRTGVKLQIGFNRRFDANFSHAQQSIASGGLGRLLSAIIISRDPVDQRPRNREDDDLFLDTTIHDLDMARFLAGAEATTVFAQGGVMADERLDDPDTAVTTLRFGNGATFVIDNTRLSGHGYDQRIEVCGDAGMLTVENVPSHTVSLATGANVVSSGPEPFFTERYFDSYVRELQSFVDCVANDLEPAVTGWDGRAAVALAWACVRSYREGRPVAVSEVEPA
jgi:myo-inositol 2-dehydrogenase/D-chiro-inositol 1-dehydrogenase